ncbi:MAG: SHOCT domain-containing protein [Sphingomonas sp.]
MRMGRLAISRGSLESESPEPPPVPLAVVPAAEAASAPAVSGSLAAVQERLDALERLTRLYEAGALTIDEFLIEKAAILGHPRSNLGGPKVDAGPHAPISFQPVKVRPRRGRSLFGRLGWFILPIGLVAGLALTALTQPDASAQIWQETLRLFGR